MDEREKLEAAIAEAKQRISDLTRAMDESPAAQEHEIEEQIENQLATLHRCLIELERALELLG